MISYHIVASVSAEQYADVLRQSERQHLVSEARVVRKRVRRLARYQRRHLLSQATVRPALLAQPGPGRTPAQPLPRGPVPSRRRLSWLRWATAPQ